MINPQAKKFQGRLYWPNCSVCQFMRTRPKFRDEMMKSTYFDPVAGTETLKDVWVRWKPDFNLENMYKHAQRHQPKDIVKAEQKLQEAGIGLIEQEVGSEDYHELTLDEFISKGRKNLREGKMSVTAANLLQAIKIKSDNVRSTKDRRLDPMKLMAGASGIKKENDGQGTQQPTSP